MKVITRDGKIFDTKDCVNILNREISINKWKRIQKFVIEGNICRVFQANGDTHSILSGKNEYWIFKDIDLYQFRDLIKRIQKRAQNYYTHDYGAIYFNPYDMTLYCNCGDGGYMYSTKPKSVVLKALEEGFEADSFPGERFISFDEQPDLPEIIATVYEAECDPDSDEFIEIAQMITD